MGAKTWLAAPFVLSVPLVAQAEAKSFPGDIAIDVTTLGVKGDGATDDTGAIQAALIGDRTPQSQPDYYAPRPRTVYFPPGTYLVSDTIHWLGQALQLQGSGSATVIKLADGAPGFGDKNKRKPIFQTEAGNYAFKNHVWDFVIDTGSNNPGAVGLDWICNNVGALRGILVKSGDGQGVAGVDLTRAWPGPALLRDVTVQGFDYGVDIAGAEYGMTFENLVLENQKIAAVRNKGNALSARRITTRGAPLSIDNADGGDLLVLLDSALGGTGPAAIKNSGRVYLRNVQSSGFVSLLEESGTARPETSVTGEYLTGKIQELFASPQKSLGLPVEELPAFHDNDLGNWQVIDCGYQGCEGKIQPALDSGKATVYFRAGVHLVGGQAFKVPRTVRRVLGFGSNMNDYDAYGMTFSVEDDGADPVIFEQFANQLKIEHKAKRTVVVKSSDLTYTAGPGAGKLMLDDVGMSVLTPAAGQSVWAWQLNIEGDQLHIDNAGGYAWIFGLKSERKGTIARTTAGGFTEFLGHLLYGTESFTADTPAFVNVESSHSIVFAMSSYVDNGFYPTLVDETRDGVQKKLPKSALDGRFMPLFVGYKEPPPFAVDAGTTPPGAMGSDATVGPGPAAGGSTGAAGNGVPHGAGTGGDADAGLAAGDAGAEGGCGCRVGRAPSGAYDALLLSLLAGIASRRRRGALGLTATVAALSCGTSEDAAVGETPSASDAATVDQTSPSPESGSGGARSADSSTSKDARGSNWRRLGALIVEPKYV